MPEISWSLVREGNEEEIERLVVKYYKVAYKIAHWWARTGQIEESEAVGLANIAIMKCIYKGSFDETREIKFSSYLGSAVHNEIRMFLRKERKNRDNVSFSLDQPLAVKGGHRSGRNRTSKDSLDSLTYGDAVLDTITLEDSMEDTFLYEDAHDVLVEAADEMSQQELRCVILYLLGLSIRQTSSSLGRSQNHTRKVLASAMTKLKDTFNEKDLL